MPKRLLTASGFANAALLATALYVVALVVLPTRVFVEVLNGLFLGMVAAATITLVVGFFSVSNAPVTTPSAPGSSVVGG